MGEFIKALEHFITRDVMYVLGGSLVMVSFAVALEPISMNTLLDSGNPVLIDLLLVGFSYVLGYAILEGSRLIRLVPPIYWSSPSKVDKKLYARFTSLRWDWVSITDPYSAYIRIGDKAPERNFASLQRIISLKHIGTTLGSNGMLASLILIFPTIREDPRLCWPIPLAIFVASMILLLIGRLKAAQQAQYVKSLLEYLD